MRVPIIIELIESDDNIHTAALCETSVFQKIEFNHEWHVNYFGQVHIRKRLSMFINCSSESRGHRFTHIY